MKSALFHFSIKPRTNPSDGYYAQVLEFPGITADGATPEIALKEIQTVLSSVMEAIDSGEMPAPSQAEITKAAMREAGRIGGSVRSAAKAKSSRLNGAKGGRPVSKKKGRGTSARKATKRMVALRD